MLLFWNCYILSGLPWGSLSSLPFFLSCLLGLVPLNEPQSQVWEITNFAKPVRQAGAENGREKKTMSTVPFLFCPMQTFFWQQTAGGLRSVQDTFVGHLQGLFAVVYEPVWKRIVGWIWVQLLSATWKGRSWGRPGNVATQYCTELPVYCVHMLCPCTH